MRVLAINYEYPPIGGGGGVVFQQICEELATRHDVEVITSGYGDLPDIEHRGRLIIHRVPVVLRTDKATATMPSMLSFWPSSQRYGGRLLAARPFDVINSHFVVPSGPSADTLARRFGLPHVLSIHGGDIYDPSKTMSPHKLPLVRGMIRRLLGKADRVVAQSTNTADNARRYYDVKRDIDVIPLGIEPTPQPEKDKAALRREMDLPEDAFVISTVGRLVERKKVDQLIDALAAMGRPEARLVVIGDGPKKQAWAQHAQQLGVEDRVELRGFVEHGDKYKLLAASDVLASTSEHEGFGLVFLEAMDQGLPVVAYDHGGQTDFLTDGVTGGVVPLGDTRRFASTLAGLAEDPGRCQQIGQANRELAADYYIQRCADQYEALMVQAIEAKGNRDVRPAAAATAT
jgi:glycosyltransferase involved in cell wall biosynthesis